MSYGSGNAMKNTVSNSCKGGGSEWLGPLDHVHQTLLVRVTVSGQQLNLVSVKLSVGISRPALKTTTWSIKLRMVMAVVWRLKYLFYTS